ncbi:MAG TPA: ATP-dependent DNA helicase RecG [Gammaproteobacteria bacterium]|jgi:ATP-dependent DNA helicase RecG|nr:ATP-dependent DNA helicase RecG [Gammaproteobacteria bacterium]
MQQDVFAQAVSTLKGVGPKVAEKLQRLDIHTVQDVLFHLPLRYQDRTRITPLGALQPGIEAVVDVEVKVTDVVFRRRRTLLCKVGDATGSLTLRFFHFSKAQQSNLTTGVRLRCFGEVRRGPSGLEMVHPEYQQLTEDLTPEASLTAIYPTTEGVHQLTLRNLTDQALALLRAGRALQDWLPPDLMAEPAMLSLSDALLTVHRPSPDDDIQALLAGVHPAHQRLCFEELLAHRLALLTLRAQTQEQKAPAMSVKGTLLNQLLEALPFALTGAQTRVIDEILTDVRQDKPMLRLVQGDVGAGKTLVAAAAATRAIEAGYQVAIMAPTEILAEQHLLNFSNWFEPLGVSVGWLSGKLTARQKRSSIEAVAMGQSQLVVGTHALFQDDVQFANLGLVVIDEQHRFGVHQRLALRNKGASGDSVPHQLIMTATPIPRTLAMTAYADLDCSVIDELPPGRKPVTTVAVSYARRAEVIDRVRAAITEGRQVYWVCTLIEESEVMQCQAAEDTYQVLIDALPEYRIGLVHGRMKSSDKEDVMARFKASELDLLVATTVIEVGVDVPNASLMIIENAERLGLSQLHQLRGRVGRGSAQSSCVLVYQPPLSKNARERIATMRDTNDGFVIAEKDLSIRGAGELLGTRQTGLAEFRIADLARDKGMLDAVASAAQQMMHAQGTSVAPLVRRWIGDRNQQYGGV